MTGSARYLCKQTWNLHTISWHAGRVKSEGASKQFRPSICSLRNGFPSIFCFTLTKDGLQTLNITAGHTLPDLQNKLIDIIKYPVPLQGTSANLCYMHPWLLVGGIWTSNDRVCKVPLQTNLKPTHHLLARWQGQARRYSKTIHAINLFPPKWLPINCFTVTKDGLQTLNITAGGKCRHHLRLPSIVNRVDRSENKLIGVVVLSNINSRFLCKVLLQTCATFMHGFL